MSGSYSFEADMVHPEVVTLCVRIVNVPCANSLDSIQNRRVLDRRCTQIGPVLPPAARDDVVHRCGGVALVVEVPVFHGVSVCLLCGIVRSWTAPGEGEQGSAPCGACKGGTPNGPPRCQAAVRERHSFVEGLCQGFGGDSGAAASFSMKSTTARISSSVHSLQRPRGGMWGGIPCRVRVTMGSMPVRSRACQSSGWPGRGAPSTASSWHWAQTLA